MAQVTVTPTVRVARIQGDMNLDQPSIVEAFFTTNMIGSNGAALDPNAPYDASTRRTIDAVENAKTITVGGKTYTHGELLNGIAAMALKWKAEDAAPPPEE